ncbi:M23 family metallopeptidase [Candidatus Daviesbacteria bacterium]|nr:M23 family metallopeptidase [Candidatus Daviesbacteria bacterium]
MNPLPFFTLWSFKKELKIVIFSFLIILSLPVIAVFMLTNAGIDIVSDKLVTSNPQNNSVEIHNPADGSVITQITPKVEWPVHGVVTLEFGQSDWPYQPFHTGIDIANPYGMSGDPITPFMEGTVTYAGEIFWGFGKHIIIDNGNYISSIYAHLDKIYVYPGEKVKLGQVIGREGQTGWATGPHLHFQIDVFGIPVDPRTFIPGNP